MSKAKTVKEVFQAMLWMFENRLGWHRHQNFIPIEGKHLNVKYTDMGMGIVEGYAADIGSACLAGCAFLVQADLDIKKKAFNILEDNCPYFGSVSISGWNDHVAKNKEDVISLLKVVMEKS